MQGLDEAARDREAEPGAGPYPIALFRPIKLVEDVLEVSGRYAVAFVQHLETDRVLVAPAPDADGVAVGGILSGIVQQVEQRLLEQHRIQLQHGQAGGKLQLDPMTRKDLARAPQRAADDLAEV